MTSIAQAEDKREVSESKQATTVERIKKSLSILCDAQTGIIELRAWTNNNGIQSGFYNDLNKLAEDATQLDINGDAGCIAITMNPVDRKLLFHSAVETTASGSGVGKRFDRARN